MRAFIAFLKKEWLESIRSGKTVLLGILFVLFGVMNPAIAKLTPWLLETLSESRAESGMSVTAVTVDALTSWTQFFKNIPMALIVFVLVYGNTFVREYETGTLILLLTKGVARYQVVLAKWTVMVTAWTVGYWLCYAVTYGYNAYFWDNAIAKGLMPAALHWWLFGVFAVCLILLFSVLANHFTGVLLGVGGSILVCYLAGLFPKVTAYMPTHLMNSAALLVGLETWENYTKAVAVTAIICLLSVAISIPVMNKKQL